MEEYMLARELRVDKELTIEIPRKPSSKRSSIELNKKKSVCHNVKR